MDFGSMIKRAWQVTWRYKSLWILGLFAGATGGGYSGGWGSSGYRYDAQDFNGLGSTGQLSWDPSAWFAQWAPVLIAVGVLALLVGLLWMVLSLAAQTGLASEVDRAEQGRPVSAGEGWATGFHYWGRAFLAALALMLPFILVGLVFAAAAVVMIVVPLTQGTSPGWPSIAGLVAAGIVAVPVFIVLGLVLGTMYVLAIRYIAIEDRSSSDAIRASWGALRHRFKDVFLMWLITLGLSIAFGFALAIPAVVAGIGIAITAVVGAWPVAALLGFVLFVLVVVLTAGWNTFTSALWTIFFRRMTGREVVQPHPLSAQPYGAPAGYPVPGPYPPVAGYPTAPGYQAPPGYAPPVAPYAPPAAPQGEPQLAPQPAPPVAPPAAPAEEPPVPGYTEAAEGEASAGPDPDVTAESTPDADVPGPAPDAT